MATSEVQAISSFDIFAEVTRNTHPETVGIFDAWEAGYRLLSTARAIGYLM
jgi:hypothetical protein